MSDQAPPNPASRRELALAFGGGGARAAYQVGVLNAVARRFPSLETPVLSGISAGAIAASYLANHTGTFQEKTEALAQLWLTLEPSQIFRTDPYSLLGRAAAIAFGVAFASPGGTTGQGVLDSSPLRTTLLRAFGSDDRTLSGVATNIQRGALKAVALTSTCYSTGQTVTFFSGRGIDAWERPQRKSVRTELTVDHVMASASLPLVFPPVRIDDRYYGDGGIRLVAPFAAAIHLGADRILAVSTRYRRSRAEADEPAFDGPPSLAQLFGVLYNAIFLDMLDQDALTMERINRLIRESPPTASRGLREVRLLVIRPSEDLGALANRFEPNLPLAFRFLTRRLGTRRAKTQDFLSTLMFNSDYLRALYDLGLHDGQARIDEIGEFLESSTPLGS